MEEHSINWDEYRRPDGTIDIPAVFDNESTPGPDQDGGRETVHLFAALVEGMNGGGIREPETAVIALTAASFISALEMIWLVTVAELEHRISELECTL